MDGESKRGGGRGRKSKSEELDLLPQKQALIERLQRRYSKGKQTLADCAAIAYEVTEAHTLGYLSKGEAEMWHNAVSIDLRRIKAENADTEVSRLEAAVVELRELKTRAHAEAATARSRAQ